MKLYDSIIQETEKILAPISKKDYQADPGKTWPSADRFELVLQKEMAFELGGEGKPSANFTCVTNDASFFHGDEIVVYGKDLSSLKGSVSFARIVLVLTEDLDAHFGANTDQLCRFVQAIDFVKYRIYPKGYMVRASGQSNREVVRISKKAIRSGISFEKIGNSFIKKYKENKMVKNVKIIFVVSPEADYSHFDKLAKKVNDITRSLSKILEGMPTECASCSIRAICDEVEELRELHFGKNK